MKSHIELYGWEIRRKSAPFNRNEWFHLFLRTSPMFPAAAGDLVYVNNALHKMIGSL